MTCIVLELIFFAALAALPSTVLAQNQNTCSLDTIKGDYGFVSSVRRPSPNGQTGRAQRARFIGLISYDGGGNAKISGLTVAPGGHASPYINNGTYSVDAAHCTGSVTFQNPQNGDSKWDFVIVSGGGELLTIIQSAADTTPFSQKKR